MSECIAVDREFFATAAAAVCTGAKLAGLCVLLCLSDIDRSWRSLYNKLMKLPVVVLLRRSR